MIYRNRYQFTQNEIIGIMKYLLIQILTFSIVFLSSGQPKDTSNMLRFTPDFKFTDGIFLNFAQVKTNSPLPKSKILTTVNFNDDDFFSQIFKEKQINFYDDLGTKQTVETKQIWGFARNGNLYIKVNDELNRITYIGSISHFIANITSYSNRVYDPYMYNSYNPYNPYSYSYGNPYGSNVPNKEVRQFILDFETGKVLDFEVKSIESILVRDPKLYDEFAALSSRKQKQLKFLYVRKFNERNPLYFPDKSKLLIK
jgi:hypothetical protein